MSHFFHNVPYTKSKSEILHYIFFRHITSLQKDVYIYIDNMYSYVCVYIYIISATPSNNTYKGLTMDIPVAPRKAVAEVSKIGNL